MTRASLKTFLQFLVLFLFSVVAAHSTTVSGTLKDLGINNATTRQTYVLFTLVNYGANIPRVLGTNTIVRPDAPPMYPNSMGAISGTIQGNDTISPVNTYYRVCIYYQGVASFSCQNYLLTGSTFNLDTATPLDAGTTPPAPAALIAMNWQGAWSAVVDYDENMTVSRLGSSYIALQSPNLNKPPESEPTYWGLLAQEGDAGATGMTGATGPTGPAGSSGGWPSVGPGYIFVSAAGDDVNDGLSPEAAKLTWDAACQALPGGSAVAPLTCGHGEVKVIGSVYANSDHTVGRWLMGTNDPNFASPPTGWMRFSGALRTTCFASDGEAGNFGPLSPLCYVNGGDTNASKPFLWLSGFAQGFNDDHVGYPNYVMGARIGIDSNGDRTTEGGGVSGVWLQSPRHNYGDCFAGAGPSIDIGSNSFWIYIDDPTLSGCVAEIWNTTATGLSRSSGTVTAVTAITGGHTATNDYVVGEWITVKNSSDSSFDGSFVVTAVSGSPQITVQWAQVGPDASNKNAELFHWRSAAVAVNPGDDGSGSGLVFVRRPGFSSAGVWFNTGVNGGGIYVDEVTMEGWFSGPSMPALLTVRPPTEGHVRVVELIADTTTRTPGYTSHNGCPENFIVEGVDQIEGCSLSMGSLITNYIKSPSVQGQSGLFFGSRSDSGVLRSKVVGQSDVAMRIFPPVSVRYPNIVTRYAPGTWTYFGGTGTVTPGVAAPDGTTGAGNATSDSGQVFINFWNSNTTATVGDRYAFAVLVQSSVQLNTGIIRFALNGDGYGSGDYCKESLAASVSTLPLSVGDGEWFIIRGMCTVYTAPADPAGKQFVGEIRDPSHPMNFYAPTLILIPVGDAISDNEAKEIADNLQPYSPDCIAGQLCTPSGAAVDNTAYNATTWDANLSAPTKNAVRDRLEPLVVGEFMWVAGAKSGAGLDSTNDDEDDIFINKTGYTITITSVFCRSDAGNPTVNILHNDGSAVAILASDLTCSTAGGTTTTFTSGENVIANGEAVNFDLTAPDTAKRASLAVSYTK